jgi:hypothetical protein
VTTLSWLTVACQALLAVTFGASAGSKLRGRDAFIAFRSSVTRLLGVPASLATPLAATVGGGELLVTVGVVVPITAPAAFVGAALLLVAFTVVIARAVRGGRTEPCRCFGTPTVGALGWLHVGRNLGLLGVAVTGAVTATLSDRTPAGPAPAVLAAAAGGITALLVIHLEHLADLFRAAPVAVGSGRPQSDREIR